MPVDEPDLPRAAEWYGRLPPARIEVFHLALGTDGQTASLVSAGPVLEVNDRPVGLTGNCEG
jgi:hypothetical protein